MSHDPKDAHEDGSAEQVLFCTRILLASLQQTKEDGWFFSEEGLLKGFEAFAKEIDGPQMTPALEQFFGIIGLLQAKLQRPDLAQRLLDEVENHIPSAKINQIQDELSSRSAAQQDDARKQFDKLLGPAPKQEEIKPREKIDFKVPKGPVKG